MAKKNAGTGSTLLGILAWFTGVVVSLVVGNAMIQGFLALPNWLGGTQPAGILVTQVIGWIVVITTIVGAVLAILRK